jgi:hypothetical protein
MLDHLIEKLFADFKLHMLLVQLHLYLVQFRPINWSVYDL